MLRKNFFINKNLISFKDENADFYVRKNLAVLIAKLVARGTLSLNQKLKGAFAHMCKTWILSGYKEELYGVLDVIGNLVLKQSVTKFFPNIIFLHQQIGSRNYIK